MDCWETGMWEMGVINGRTWHWRRAPICEILVVPLKTKVWHLFSDLIVDGEREYCGHFDTKRAMLEYAKQHSGERQAA